MSAAAYAVILAGGRGERFWPLSTALHPKQVLPLLGGKPMLAASVERVAGLIPPERVLVITGAGLVDVTRRAAPELPHDNVIGEPFGRDTAAACALGLAAVAARDPDAVICVLTADHAIGDAARFRATLRACIELAAGRDALITLGIPPSRPSTGFGYIEAGPPASGDAGGRFREALRFVEKPDRVTAERYVASGRFFWNSGMFVWSVRSFRRALERHAPALADMAARVGEAAGTREFDARVAEAYASLGRVSVDYAIMEKARNVLVTPADFEWDDLGTWSALARHLPADGSGNAIVGACESLAAHDNLVHSEGRLTALIGVSDLVVVQTPEATLICAKDRAEDVKQMVSQLRERGGFEGLL